MHGQEERLAGGRGRDIRDNPAFARAYQRLRHVAMDGRRSTCVHAHGHCEMVSKLAGRLGAINGCDGEQVALLENLGRVHGIAGGASTATGSEGRGALQQSLEVLRDCRIRDRELLALVVAHDTAARWYRASQIGRGPTDRAWQHLQRRVDVRLLVLFTVATRLASPAGWRRDAAALWFVEQARERGVLCGRGRHEGRGSGSSSGPLVLDVPGYPSAVSAGGALVHAGKVLLIRVRRRGFELPKGGIEWDELPREAALRETCEEAGLESSLRAGPTVGRVEYEVGSSPNRYLKRVDYFRLFSDTVPRMGLLPRQTRERRWIGLDALSQVELVSEELRPVLQNSCREGP